MCRHISSTSAFQGSLYILMNWQLKLTTQYYFPTSFNLKMHYFYNGFYTFLDQRVSIYQSIFTCTHKLFNYDYHILKLIMLMFFSVYYYISSLMLLAILNVLETGQTIEIKNVKLEITAMYQTSNKSILNFHNQYRLMSTIN